MLLTHRYLIQKIVLLPGKSNTISESLSVGPLRHLLDNHPQQTYRITFRAILDPVPDGNGGFQGKIPALQPSPVTITRKAFIPTQERLNSYFNSLATGLPAERIRVVQLMAGLLREAQLARQERLNYNITSIDEPTMRELIGRNLNHPDSRVRAWSAYALHSLPLSADSSQGQQLTELLNDSSWFVRFLALNTLDPVADMTEYFNWVNILEKNIIIQRQVQLFQHLPWPVVEVPVEVPKPSTASTPTGI